MTCTLNGIYAQTAEMIQKANIAKTVKTKETMKDKDKKFKGKRLDTGEYFTGNLVVNKSTRSYRIISNFGFVTDGQYLQHGCHRISGEIHLVDPDSIQIIN